MKIPDSPNSEDISPFLNPTTLGYIILAGVQENKDTRKIKTKFKTKWKLKRNRFGSVIMKKLFIDSHKLVNDC